MFAAISCVKFNRELPPLPLLESFPFWSRTQLAQLVLVIYSLCLLKRVCVRARESVSRCKCAKKVNVIKMNSSLLLLRAALRPVNDSRFVPRRPRPKAISSTLFCCPQSTAASATLRFNFLSLSLSGGAGCGRGVEWGMSPFSSRLLLRAAALIKAARLSFLSCSRRLPLPSSPSAPAASAAAACFGAFYNNYSLGFVNISCRRCRTWLRFVRPPLLTASSFLSLLLRPSIFYDSIIRCAFAGASKSPSIPASS